MASRPDDSREKGLENPELQSTRSGSDGTKATSVNQDENLTKWTKAGCTLESFRRREATGSPDLLNKTMKSRHLQMIASGGSIGAGFFVGSGSALFKGGPGTLLIDFLIMGVMIFNVVQALGELAVMYPVSGGFYTFSSRFIDPAWGFAMGWNYVFQWAVCLPLELVVASLTIAYWNSEINPAIWISVFLGALIIINIFGTLGYAEEEFWTSVIKLLTVIIFMIICLIFVLGGGPSKGIYNEYWGARLWYDPGAFKNGFEGFCSVFVTAAFSFAGTELVGLAAAESENPAKSLPGAIKQVFWRITIFYIIGLMFIGLLVSCTDSRLLGSGGMIDVNASPFVIVAINGGIKGFDHLINGIILMSIISLGNSAIYGGSRTLTALADKGYAPKIFSYIDKSGRPLFSTIVLLAFGCLAYISLSSSGDNVFEWLLALSGLSSLFTWASICLAHIRFRAAWKAHDRSLEEIPYKAAGGVYGSWCGLILIIVVIMAQFYTALFPLGNNGKIGTAKKFFQSFLAVPVVITMYIIGWVWKRKSWWSIDDIDIETDLREVDWNTINEYRALIASYPAWKRVWYYLF